MTATNNASIGTTEVLVSPKGEMIAVASLTDAKGSLLSACATPSSNQALSCSSPNEAEGGVPAPRVSLNRFHPHPLCRTPHLALADRSGQSVKTDAAKYITHHDAEGIAEFLNADLEELTSVLSFTVDYLAGTL